MSESRRFSGHGHGKVMSAMDLSDEERETCYHHMTPAEYEQIKHQLGPHSMKCVQTVKGVPGVTECWVWLKREETRKGDE